MSKFELSRKARDRHIAFWKELVYNRALQWREIHYEYCLIDSMEGRRTQSMLVRDIDTAEACIGELLFLNVAADANLKEYDVAPILYKGHTIKNDRKQVQFWNKEIMLIKKKSIWLP